MFDKKIHSVSSEKSREQQESMSEYIFNFVSSLTEDQCKSALKILKPLSRKMCEEPALASQLLEDAESKLRSPNYG